MKKQTNILGGKDPGGNPQEFSGLLDIQLIRRGKLFWFSPLLLKVLFNKNYSCLPPGTPCQSLICLNMHRKGQRVGAQERGEERGRRAEEDE